MADETTLYDPPRRLLADLIAERGADLAGVSRAIGRNHAYLSQFLRGTTRELPERAREALGRYFQIAPDRFRAPNEAGDDAAPAELIDQMLAGLGEIDRPRRQLAVAAATALLEGEAPPSPVVFDELVNQIYRALTSAAAAGRPITTEAGAAAMVERLARRWALSYLSSLD